jgi:hypothetical protein
MNVQLLTVGPILGATTGDTARVWGRAELEQLSLSVFDRKGELLCSTEYAY